MRISRAEAFIVRVPFGMPVSHAAASRGETVNVLVRLVDASGASGWGEGVPRPYVTGENPQGVYRRLAETILPALVGVEAGEPGEIDRIIARSLAPSPGTQSAVCAAETALLDLAGRLFGLPAGGWFLPARLPKVRYSAVVPILEPAALEPFLQRLRAHGFARVKVKVGDRGDVERVTRVRDILGHGVGISLDANGAWTPISARSALAAMARAGIDWVEQPLPRGDEAELAALAGDVPVRIMADESLVSLQDAERLARVGGCSLFNLRLSKLGGMMASARIAALAGREGIGVQVGCQVGETAILSAAGRIFAASIPALTAVEGSFGTMMLSRDLSTSPFEFGPGGFAEVQAGPGLGIEVDEGAVREMSLQEFRVGS